MELSTQSNSDCSTLHWNWLTQHQKPTNRSRHPVTNTVLVTSRGQVPSPQAPAGRSRHQSDLCRRTLTWFGSTSLIWDQLVSCRDSMSNPWALEHSLLLRESLHRWWKSWPPTSTNSKLKLKTHFSFLCFSISTHKCELHWNTCHEVSGSDT